MKSGSGARVLVRFSEPAMPVEQLLKALGEQSHTSFFCSPEVRDEILLPHVHDLPLQEVMDRIAEVAGARWRQRGDT